MTAKQIYMEIRKDLRAQFPPKESPSDTTLEHILDNVALRAIRLLRKKRIIPGKIR
jgi:hypothetical protein